MKSRSVTRAAGGIAVVAASVFISSNVLAAGITLSQCANGGVKEDIVHDQCHDGWISGNANQSKAAYAEGQFLPYRVVITGLTPGETYTYRFSWDTLKSDKHAIDYIGTFNESVVDADPCDGLPASCLDFVDMMAIPEDPVVSAYFSPTAGEMTSFGGSLLGFGDFGTDTLGLTQSLSVHFAAQLETVVLAWGGHIASPSDWGDGTTASDINGSPYHTSNIALLDSNGVPLASGSQDVALSASAIYVPSATTVRKIANRSGTFTFEASLGNTTLSPEGEGPAWTLQDGEETVLKAQDDGVLSISEINLPEGDWRIKSITCTKVGGGSEFTYVYGQHDATDTAAFEVDEAGSFVCEFENEFFGAPVLGVIKRVVGVDDSCIDNDLVRTDETYDTRSIRSGETVKYCYWVSNTGSDAALGVTLTDDLATPALAADDVQIALRREGAGEPVLDGIDLAPGELLVGELEVKLEVAMGTSVENIATAVGEGQYDHLTYEASDFATVNVDTPSTCTLSATVNSGMGGCPGDTTAYVIKGVDSEVTWCAHVTWDQNAVLPLQDIVVSLEGSSVENGNVQSIEPMGNREITVGTLQQPFGEDYPGKLVLTGTEGGLNVVSCSGSAVVDALAPGLKLEKTATADPGGDCSQAAHDVVIINGEPVWYCFTVENTGDAYLEDVTIVDEVLGLNFGPFDLPAFSETVLLNSGPHYPEATVTNEAEATATERETRSQVGPEFSSATVTVLKADVRVEKSVDTETIILCGPEGDLDGGGSCIDISDSGIVELSYTVTVRNFGPSEAWDVTLTDYLPDGFELLSEGAIDTGGYATCVTNSDRTQIHCDLSDMASKAEVTIIITGVIDIGEFDLPWQSFRNQACAATTPANLDPETGNNCDDASTHVSTGPTRTIGWWGTHPDGLAKCMELGKVELEYASVDLGFVVIDDEIEDDEIDATVSTDATVSNRARVNKIEPEVVGDFDDAASFGVDLAKGLLNAGTARWKDGTRRSEIDQERIKAGRQLTAAWCNEVVLGSEFDHFYLGWETIRLIMLGEACFPDLDTESCIGSNKRPDLDLILSSINAVGGVADMFNNSGDALPNGFPSSSANPDAPEDDPTDPSD